MKGERGRAPARVWLSLLLLPIQGERGRAPARVLVVVVVVADSGERGRGPVRVGGQSSTWYLIIV